LVEEYGRDDISLASSVSFVATGAAIGAGVGFGVDAMIKGRRVIYSRPRPSTGGNAMLLPLWRPHRKGVLVSLRF
jgi:hypothetical protein